jgi:uncharacterized membrane protein YhiD involved in acid resistance
MDKESSFQDFFIKSFSQLNFTDGITSGDIITVLIITFLMGMFIFYIYKVTFQGVLYTQSYNVSLVMVSLVTSLIIMTISTNFILSLGMVGALSIVRFRTAIKDSMDIVFMFWAISIGIANGAGLFHLSLIGSLAIAGVLLVLTRFKSRTAPYLLIINYDDAVHDRVIVHLKSKLPKYNLKAKTVANSHVELSVEVRIGTEDSHFVNTISRLDGVDSAVLVSYNGDYVS